MYKYPILFLLIFGFQLTSFPQEEVIKLINPSFEGKPHIGQRFNDGVKNDSIIGWDNYVVEKFPNQSAPDLHFGISQDTNIVSEIFGVKQVASDGQTYLGMVVRENET